MVIAFENNVAEMTTMLPAIEVSVASRRLPDVTILVGPAREWCSAADPSGNPNTPGSRHPQARECDHLNWPRFGLLLSRISAPPGW